MGIVAGWGRLSEGGQLPNILQYVSNTSGTSTRESAIIVQGDPSARGKGYVDISSDSYRGYLRRN